MNFLFPWFLAATVLIVGPIVAHLIRRATRERVPFSTLRFLEESPPRLTRRSRLEHPLLLLLRCLIILALAAAFARPFLRSGLPEVINLHPAQALVVVLDESASMQRTGLWDAAVKKVNDLAASMDVSDQFALYSAGSGVTEIISPEQWKHALPGERATLVRAALATQKPGWGPTYLDSAMETASAAWEQMADAKDASVKKRMEVVSDFAGGSRISGLAGMAWPPHVEVVLDPVKTNTTNAGLQWLGWAADTGNGPAARVRVVQSKAHPGRNLQLQLVDAKTDKTIGAVTPLTVPAGDSQVALINLPVGQDGPWKLQLTGDDEPYDDTLWIVRSLPRQIALSYYGPSHSSTDTSHPRFYLERAIEGWKDPAVQFRLGYVEQPGSTGNATTAPDAVVSANATVAANSTVTGNITAPTAPPVLVNLAPSAGGEIIVVAEPLDAAAVASIRPRLEGGAVALVLLNSPEMVATAADLLKEKNWTPVTPEGGATDARLGQIDFQHPLFILFDDPRFNDFSHIHFWHPQSVKLPDKTTAKVVASFDDETPAVLEAPVGRGRVVIWGGDWTPSASQWILSTKFIPWFQSLVENAAGGAAKPSAAEVGDTARLAAPGPAKWRPALEASAAFTEAPPTKPGVYELQQEGRTRTVAVEVPAAESRVEPLAPEAFEQIGVPLPNGSGAAARSAAEVRQQAKIAQIDQLEDQQKLWRWALILVAGLLAIESLLSYVLARRQGAGPTGTVAT